MTAAHAPLPAPTLDTFGARLAIIRHAQGWNTKEAALACRLPEGSWREWEERGRRPRNFAEVAQAISEATGYSDYWILTGRTLDVVPGPGIRKPKKKAPAAPSTEPRHLLTLAA